jgi:methylenetetrahydrofolate dehydrogenase (NADP+)/methenyltetrahydrofolate cyclohydrolase
MTEQVFTVEYSSVDTLMARHPATMVAFNASRESPIMPASSVIVLDGVRLAAQRLNNLLARSRAVVQRRGMAPRLGILAFADADGRAPHVAGKVRAGAAAGVEVIVRVVPWAADIDEARRVLETLMRDDGMDGIFVLVPYPDAAWAPQLEAMIPPAVDVDVMSPERVTGVLNGVERLPPVTVSAALALIDAHDVRVAGRRGLVIAEPSDFAAMFRLAFVRCGVQMLPLIRPAETTLHERLREVTVVIAAAGIPGSVRANQLAPGTVAIDVGYFNPGGRGDIDINERIAHLDAIAPVPGSIGPMTVSCLVERTILFAERRIA